MSTWQVVDSVEQNSKFKIESNKAKADSVTAKDRAGLPAALERSDIVRIVNVAWQNSFTRVETNKKATAACGWGPLNYILLDHPELQETKDMVKSINEIYEKQVRDGIDITCLSTLNTDQGSMGLCMDMFIPSHGTQHIDHIYQHHAPDLYHQCLASWRERLHHLHSIHKLEWKNLRNQDHI
jgi:hypothetical protein